MTGPGRASESGAGLGESPGAQEARTLNVAGSSWEEAMAGRGGGSKERCWGLHTTNTCARCNCSSAYRCLCPRPPCPSGSATRTPGLARGRGRRALCNKVHATGSLATLQADVGSANQRQCVDRRCPGGAPLAGRSSSRSDSLPQSVRRAACETPAPPHNIATLQLRRSAQAPSLLGLQVVSFPPGLSASQAAVHPPVLGARLPQSTFAGCCCDL